MRKNRKYSIVGLFSTFSKIRWNSDHTNHLHLNNSYREPLPSQRSPEEMQIDELFARFTASPVRRNIRRD